MNAIHLVWNWLLRPVEIPNWSLLSLWFFVFVGQVFVFRAQRSWRKALDGWAKYIDLCKRLRMK